MRSMLSPPSGADYRCPARLVVPVPDLLHLATGEHDVPREVVGLRRVAYKLDPTVTGPG